MESNVADFGVVPIENSTEGTVNNTDMFVTSPLKICGEVELKINHHLAEKWIISGTFSVYALMNKPYLSVEAGSGSTSEIRISRSK